MAVSLTSMLSPAATGPELPGLEQLPLLVLSIVHASSVAPVVLSTTATTTVSVPVTVVVESAYSSLTIAPLSGVGPARRLLLLKPLVFGGQGPLPGPARSV